MKREVEERILYDGTVKTALNEDSVREAVRYLKEQGAQTIAVCTLFSFINPKHEIRIREIINGKNIRRFMYPPPMNWFPNSANIRE